MVERQQIFPIVLVVLDIGAALVYAWDLDWRRAIYWFAAAVLTLMVTI
jgi:hypothetical protein